MAENHLLEYALRMDGEHAEGTVAGLFPDGAAFNTWTTRLKEEVILMAESVRPVPCVLVCRPFIDRTEGFSDKVLDKAGDLFDIEQDSQYPQVWWVKHMYRVQVEENGQWASCTCAHGLNHARATCYHAAAVLTHAGWYEC